MINLKSRSPQKELLDMDDIPFADIQQNMKELNNINTYLGGHLISIAGLKELLKRKGSGLAIVVCEVGCGGGDNLKAIEKWCKQNSIDVRFTGIDLKETCINFARQQYPELNAEWIISDYKNVHFTGNKPTFIFTSLFCHHFSNEELVSMLQWMKGNSGSGFFINDLHRHPLAYHAIKAIAKLFSRSYLVQNDAPLSVARGFKKEEWKKLFNAAGINQYSIRWKWAFRHLIIYSNER